MTAQCYSLLDTGDLTDFKIKLLHKVIYLQYTLTNSSHVYNIYIASYLLCILNRLWRIVWKIITNLASGSMYQWDHRLNYDKGFAIIKDHKTIEIKVPLPDTYYKNWYVFPKTITETFIQDVKVNNTLELGIWQFCTTIGFNIPNRV